MSKPISIDELPRSGGASGKWPWDRWATEVKALAPGQALEVTDELNGTHPKVFASQGDSARRRGMRLFRRANRLFLVPFEPEPAEVPA